MLPSNHVPLSFLVIHKHQHTGHCPARTWTICLQCCRALLATRNSAEARAFLARVPASSRAPKAFERAAVLPDQCRGSSQGLAALRDRGPAEDRNGSEPAPRPAARMPALARCGHALRSPWATLAWAVTASTPFREALWWNGETQRLLISFAAPEYRTIEATATPTRRLRRTNGAFMPGSYPWSERHGCRSSELGGAERCQHGPRQRCG